MSKRAGKTNLRARYKGHTHGPGGLKCPCCGGDSSRLVRHREKQQVQQEIAEAQLEGGKI